MTDGTVAVVVLAALLAVAAALGWYLRRWEIAAHREREEIARTLRIATDRDVIYGRTPLPPGVTIEAALARQARTGDALIDAAVEVYAERTRAVILKSIRRPRPGD